MSMANNDDSLKMQAVLLQQEEKLRGLRLLLQNQQSQGNIQEQPILLAAAAISESRELASSVLNSASLTGVTTLLVSNETSSASSNMKKDENASHPEDDQEGIEEEQDEEGLHDHESDEEYFKDFEACDDNRVSMETFPLKLYRMLYEVEQEGKQNIISFLSKGTKFIVHKPKAFVDEVMPKYFTTCRIASFQRQLNLYGFKRITEGREKGAYYHESFRKGQRPLCRYIKRQKTRIPKGEQKSAPSSDAPSAIPSCASQPRRITDRLAPFPGILGSAGLIGGGMLPSAIASQQAVLLANSDADSILGSLSGLGPTVASPAALAIVAAMRNNGANSSGHGSVAFQSVLQEAIRVGLGAASDASSLFRGAAGGLPQQQQGEEEPNDVLSHLRQQLRRQSETSSPQGQ